MVFQQHYPPFSSASLWQHGQAPRTAAEERKVSDQEGERTHASGQPSGEAVQPPQQGAGSGEQTDPQQEQERAAQQELLNRQRETLIVQQLMRIEQEVQAKRRREQRIIQIQRNSQQIVHYYDIIIKIIKVMLMAGIFYFVYSVCKEIAEIDEL